MQFFSKFKLNLGCSKKLTLVFVKLQFIFRLLYFNLSLFNQAFFQIPTVNEFSLIKGGLFLQTTWRLWLYLFVWLLALCSR